MKKDKEWLKNEINNVTSRIYGADFGTFWEINGLIDQLDESQKPVIPQFVADYIELNKGWSEDRQEYIEDDSNGLWFALDGNSYGMPNSVSDWLFNEEKVETFAKAWLDGYEIEKEKLYRVKDNNGTLLCKAKGEVMTVTKALYIGYEQEFYHLTEKEIKDYDKRYWAFAEPV